MSALKASTPEFLRSVGIIRHQPRGVVMVFDSGVLGITGKSTDKSRLASQPGVFFSDAEHDQQQAAFNAAGPKLFTVTA